MQILMFILWLHGHLACENISCDEELYSFANINRDRCTLNYIYLIFFSLTTIFINFIRIPGIMWIQQYSAFVFDNKRLFDNV